MIYLSSTLNSTGTDILLFGRLSEGRVWATWKQQGKKSSARHTLKTRGFRKFNLITQKMLQSMGTIARLNTYGIHIAN